MYWGNYGLDADNCSDAGSNPSNRDTINTVENVFVCPLAPATEVESGDWVVRVSADEINEDGHTETPEPDADFALVVTGVGKACCLPFGGCVDASRDECDALGGAFRCSVACSTPGFRCFSQQGPSTGGP